MDEILSLDLSFKTLAVALLVLFAIKAFVKGVLRQIWGMICLALGGVAGYFIFQNGSEWIGKVIEHPSGAVIEVMDADPRRIKRLRVHLPGHDAD